MKGINYSEIYENDYRKDMRDSLQGYHHCSRIGVLDYTKGAKRSDIAQMKKVDRSNLHMINGDFDSAFGIGFEVEKNRFGRGALKALELFAGFERDSSCGVEAVTNILPLLPASTWRNKVFSMMHDARKVIEDAYSPSDYRCGGHATISVDGMTGEELLAAVKPFVGILYAMFRYRLNNRFCYANNRLEADYIGTRYTVVNVKSDRMEFRLPSRITSVKQLMRRYELFFELVNYAINKPNGTHGMFLRKVRPIVSSMYEGNEQKVDEIMRLAVLFQGYVNTGRVADDIRQFLPMRS